MKKTVAVISVVLWCAILFGIGGYYVYFAPQEESYSETENRMLAAFPDMKASLVKGTIDEDLEAYLLDRFPLRDRAVSGSKAFLDTLSTATYEQFLLADKGKASDALSGDADEDDIDALLAEQFHKITRVPTEKVTPTAVVTVSPEPGTTGIPTPTIELPPEENPPIEPKPERDESEWPDRLRLGLKAGEKMTVIRYFSKRSVLAVTAVLNKYAALLPEDGKLMFTMVPQSVYINPYVNAGGDRELVSEEIELMNAMSLDNVYAFDTPQILSRGILDGEYLYFRTDMHWTPVGAYRVYCEMAWRAGKQPCSYEYDFEHTVEKNFLGTMYRSDPSDYLKSRADTLELNEPLIPHELRRLNAKGESRVVPFLNKNAPSNDRYAVYFSGPGGPWTTLTCENDQTENCLVLCDSFGLCFMPFLSYNYHQVHYYDPRYFDKKAVGGTLAELIEKYEIQDIYVIVGDLHCFDSDFLITSANKQLGQ